MLEDTTDLSCGDSVRRVPISTSLDDPGDYRSRAAGPPIATRKGRERGEQSRSILRIEDATEVKVGQWYDVPWIRLSEQMHNFKAAAHIPILGDIHNDSEIIGFPHDHWHIDWRFANHQTWQWATAWAEYRKAKPDLNGIALAKILVVEGPTRLIEQGRSRMRCRRPHPVFPTHVEGGYSRFLHKLEDAYAHASAKCGRCPHRGISLAGAPIENGARVCPGHGLAYSVETGKLVRRAV